MVDQVSELIKGKSLKATKTFSFQEINSFLNVSSTRNNSMFIPESLISESIGQAGIIFFKAAIEKLREGIQLVLSHITVDFKDHLLIGQQLVSKITPIKILGNACILHAKGVVNNGMIAEGEMGLIIRKPI